MTISSDIRFELRQVTGIEWIIRDQRYASHDARGTVARIWRVDEDHCEVDWLVDTCLPTRYVCPANVIEDLHRTVSRSTKPVPIPHFAPVGARATERPE